MNECHYITDGNHHAYGMVQMCKKLMNYMGLDPERLRIEQMSAGEGIRYAEIMNDFSETLRKLGPLGEGEGIDKAGLKLKLETITKLIPYIRLVERERLRVRFDTAEKYTDYFNSEEVSRLFQELIFDKLAVAEIMELLRKSPRSAGEISDILGLDSSEVSRHLNVSARQGLAKFDENQKRFIPA